MFEDHCRSVKVLSIQEISCSLAEEDKFQGLGRFAGIEQRERSERAEYQRSQSIEDGCTESTRSFGESVEGSDHPSTFWPV